MSSFPPHEAQRPPPPSNSNLYPPPPATLNANPSLISLDSSTTEKDCQPYPTTTDPFSPFYSHPPTRTSLEQRKSESRVHVTIATPPPSTSKEDLCRPENSRPKTPGTKHCSDGRAAAAAATSYSSSSSARRRSRLESNLAGTVRGSRACGPYRRLSRRGQWVVKFVVLLVVIALGVGLGVGISRAVGAGVWRSDNSTFDLPEEEGGA